MRFGLSVRSWIVRRVTGTMGKTLCFILTLMFGILSTSAETLCFHENGSFKIVQFTDFHYIYGDKRSDAALDCINKVLDAEKPDLVLLTGDLIYGRPAEKGLRTILELIAARHVPFGVVFGNHDDEQGLSRKELLDIISGYPGNLTASQDSVHGMTNYVLPILSADGGQASAVLYCMDSNSYSCLQGISGYDYIRFDQIAWYRSCSEKYTAQHHGQPLPALAFFHIPLPEYRQAVTDENTVVIGTRMEKVCAPELNSGLFAAMREMGDVKGVFVGHDHDNDYVALWKNVLLAYGRYSGGNTVYNHLSNGARVIEWHENGAKFDTWIRLRDGSVIQKVTYPDDLVKKD